MKSYGRIYLVIFLKSSDPYVHTVDHCTSLAQRAERGERHYIEARSSLALILVLILFSSSSFSSFSFLSPLALSLKLAEAGTIYITTVCGIDK